MGVWGDLFESELVAGDHLSGDNLDFETLRFDASGANIDALYK